MHDNDYTKDLLDFTYQNLKISLLGLLLSGLVVTFTLFRYVSEPLLLFGWYLLLSLLTAIRYYLMYLYTNFPRRYDLARWMRLFWIFLTLSTLLWTAGLYFAVEIDDPVPLAILAAIYAGVAAGGAMNLAAFYKAALLFLTLPLAIFIGILLSKGSDFALQIALLLLFYLLFLLVVTKRMEKQLVSVFVTNKKYRLEKQIAQESKNRLKAVFEHSPVGIFFYNERYDLIDANKRFYQILQLPSIHKVPPALQPFLDAKKENVATINGRHLKILTAPIYQNERYLGSVGILHDITNETRLLQQTRYQARYDCLTNIPNRSSLFEKIDDNLKKRKSFAVLFIDLDNFKQINDSLGHQIGDKILIEISNRLKKAIRKSDFIARLGGDEFVVILHDLESDKTKSAQIIDKITQKLHETISRPIKINDLTLRLTSSIGVAFIQDHDIDPFDIIKFADIAMYQAKKEGKNSTRFYQKEMDRWIKRRLEIESALKDAIKGKEFTLAYQPIARVEDDGVVAVEALLRWKNSRFGKISISEVISIAEECGAIVEIGEWILQQALKDFKKLERHLERVAINISIKQFNDTRFVQKLKNIAQQSGVKFHQIELEITESLFIHHKEHAKAIMQELRSLGFSLSIDDFGTGYSSLSYLKLLPFTTLKIDRSFIREIPEDTESAKLVESIVSIAKNFNLRTVVEGIETDTQLHFVRQSGADLYQGYLLSKPLEYDKLLQFLKRIDHAG